MDIKTPSKKHLNVFVIGLSTILLLLAWKNYRHANTAASYVLIGLFAVLFITYFLKRNLVISFYYKWMKVVTIIGSAITGIITIVLFYLVFSPVGILLRIIRKDLLHLKKDPSLNTYWIDRPHKDFKQEDYEKQF